MDDSQVICFCYNVTRGEILEAIRKEGARDPRRIEELTLAGTGCGGCGIEQVWILEGEAKRTAAGT